MLFPRDSTFRCTSFDCNHCENSDANGKPRITPLRLQCLSCGDGGGLHHGARSGLVWLEGVLCTDSRVWHAWGNCQAQEFSFVRQQPGPARPFGSWSWTVLVSGRRLRCEIATPAGCWSCRKSCRRERGYDHHVVSLVSCTDFGGQVRETRGAWGCAWPCGGRNEWVTSLKLSEVLMNCCQGFSFL